MPSEYPNCNELTGIIFDFLGDDLTTAEANALTWIVRRIVRFNKFKDVLYTKHMIEGAFWPDGLPMLPPLCSNKNHVYKMLRRLEAKGYISFERTGHFSTSRRMVTINADLIIQRRDEYLLNHGREVSENVVPLRRVL